MTFSVVIVGAENIGKTQLARRMAGESFELQYVPSIGINEFIIEGEKKYSLQDVPGFFLYQPIVHPRKKADIVLLCYDPSNYASFQRAKQDFLDAQREVQPDCQFILVETSNEKQDVERQVSHQEVQQFMAKNTKIQLCLVTDSKTGAGIEQLQNHIQGILGQREEQKPLQANNNFQSEIPLENSYFWLDALAAVAAAACIGLLLAALITVIVVPTIVTAAPLAAPLAVGLCAGAAICGVVAAATFFYRRYREKRDEELYSGVEQSPSQL